MYAPPAATFVQPERNIVLRIREFAKTIQSIRPLSETANPQEWKHSRSPLVLRLTAGAVAGCCLLTVDDRHATFSIHTRSTSHSTLMFDEYDAKEQTGSHTCNSYFLFLWTFFQPFCHKGFQPPKTSMMRRFAMTSTENGRVRCRAITSMHRSVFTSTFTSMRQLGLLSLIISFVKFSLFYL